MRVKIFFCLFICSITHSICAQTEKDILNSFKYLVVKPNNKHVEYSDIIKNAIENKFKEKGFTNILPQTALYSADYNPCEIVTCEYNLTMISGTSPEMLTELNFFDCNYTIVYSSKEKGKYTFFNEKSTTKHINGHLTVFYDFKYSYQPKVAAKVIEPPKNAEVVAQRTSDDGTSKQNTPKEGNYFALIIGISDYIDALIPDLDNLPVNDAEKLSEVLQSQYTFLPNNIVLLKNPSRRDIVIALDNLSVNVGKNDNVLVFYAGHGHYDSENQIGYWLPNDAEMGNTSNWIYNDQLVASVKKIKSKHTLLISDACFSGSIFKSRSINLQNAGEALKKKYELPSRKAITSGTLKTVPNVSVFMKYLLDRLNNTPEDYFSAGQLFQSIEIPVGNNSPTTPQYGVIQNVGDEGGDFIFIRKK
jgi:hypothetical protein